MYVCMYVSMYVCKRTHTYKHSHTHTHTHTHIYIFICIHLHIYLQVNMPILTRTYLTGNKSLKVIVYSASIVYSAIPIMIICKYNNAVMLLFRYNSPV